MRQKEEMKLPSPPLKKPSSSLFSFKTEQGDMEEGEVFNEQDLSNLRIYE